MHPNRLSYRRPLWQCEHPAPEYRHHPPSGYSAALGAARRRLGVAICVAALAALVPGAAQSQAWPSKPVTVVVPFPAGGGTDAFARPLFAQLTRQLEAFAKAGIGGVEITPIYGVRGADARDIEYLSPRWVEMMAHVTREARRLGLGVDMATGTGWPFGGPFVVTGDASSSLQFMDGQLGGKPTDMKVKRAS